MRERVASGTQPVLGVEERAASLLVIYPAGTLQAGGD